MSDKKKSEPNKPSDDKAATPSGPSAIDTENQQGLSASINLSSSSVDAKPNSQDEKLADTSTEQKPATKTTSDMSKAPVKKTSAATPPKMRATNTTEQKNKLSKTAVVALLIALLAIAASAGHYYWNEQQKAQFSQQLNDEFQQQLQLSQAKVSQQLLQQKQQNNSQLKTIEASVQRNTESNIKQLQQQLVQLKQQIRSLSQNQPSDWLLHEAEYLIRVASRSLWLEKDTTAAIGLLHDAERRIQELNDPQFLSLRQTIQQDIASLQLLPKLKTDEVMLKLMGLEHQIKNLPLATIGMPEKTAISTNSSISDNASDWRENLVKVWDKFINDYITVRRRTGNVEPLMSPQFEQNLRENLSLKLQTAIWSARKSNNDIYTMSLNDIQIWLITYFNMSNAVNQNFNQSIEQLKTATISFDYPNDLESLAIIREVMQSLTNPSILNKEALEGTQQNIPTEPKTKSNADLLEGE